MALLASSMVSVTTGPASVVSGAPQAVSPAGWAMVSWVTAYPVAVARVRVRPAIRRRKGVFTSGLSSQFGCAETITGRLARFSKPILLRIPLPRKRVPGRCTRAACGEDAVYERRGTPRGQSAVAWCRIQRLACAGGRGAETRR